MENERCGQCGLPKYICQNESNDIDFRIEVETCHATKRLQEKERRDEELRSKGKKGKPQPAPAGEAGYPVPYTLSGVSLSSMREPYYEQQAKRREAMEADRPST